MAISKRTTAIARLEKEKEANDIKTFIIEARFGTQDWTTSSKPMISVMQISKALRVSTHHVRQVCQQAVAEASDGGANQINWDNLDCIYNNTV